MSINMKERNAKLVEMMRTNPMVIDNHTGKEEVLTGLVEFYNPEKGLACCFDARYYSLNACLLSNGELHCSMASIGGVLRGAYPDAEQIRKYNDGCIFEGGKIKCIHRPDGTKVYSPDYVPLEKMSSFAAYFAGQLRNR